MSSCDADFIFLTETWLSSDICDHEIFPTNLDYTVYRCDRKVRRGGDVLIAIRNHICSSLVPIVSNLEIIFVRLGSHSSQTIIGICYRPPNFTEDFVNQPRHVLSQGVTSFPNYSFILLADFNFSDINWLSLSAKSLISKDFTELCQSFYFNQMIVKPTRTVENTRNLLELCLSTDPNLINNIIHLPPSCDHDVIRLNFTFNIYHKATFSKIIKDYNKADYTSINNFLELYYDEFEIEAPNHSISGYTSKINF